MEDNELLNSMFNTYRRVVKPTPFDYIQIVRLAREVWEKGGTVQLVTDKDGTRLEVIAPKRRKVTKSPPVN